MDLDGLKEARVQSYSAGGASVHSFSNFNRIRQVAPMCPHGKAYWHHLANTIGPSVSGGDAVLRQITFTTCRCFNVTSKLHNCTIIYGNVDETLQIVIWEIIR